jgi:hypothetical protein
MKAREICADSSRKPVFTVVLLWAALLLSGSDVYAVATFVKTIGTSTTQSTGTTISVTVPAAGVAAGNSIIVAFGMDGTAGTVSCTDSSGNGYQVDSSVINSTTKTSRTVICSAHKVTALAPGNTITVTSPSTATRAISAFEFSGLVPRFLLSDSADKKSTATGSSATPSSGLTATTTMADELVFGSITMSFSFNDAFTPGAGLTLIGRAGTTGNSPYDMTINPQYKIVSATGNYGVNGTNERATHGRQPSLPTRL